MYLRQSSFNKILMAASFVQFVEVAQFLEAEPMRPRNAPKPDWDPNDPFRNRVNYRKIVNELISHSAKTKDNIERYLAGKVPDWDTYFQPKKDALVNKMYRIVGRERNIQSVLGGASSSSAAASSSSAAAGSSSAAAGSSSAAAGSSSAAAGWTSRSTGFGRPWNSSNPYDYGRKTDMGVLIHKIRDEVQRQQDIINDQQYHRSGRRTTPDVKKAIQKIIRESVHQSDYHGLTNKPKRVKLAAELLKRYRKTKGKLLYKDSEKVIKDGDHVHFQDGTYIYCNGKLFEFGIRTNAGVYNYNYVAWFSVSDTSELEYRGVLMVRTEHQLRKSIAAAKTIFYETSEPMTIYLGKNADINCSTNRIDIDVPLKIVGSDSNLRVNFISVTGYPQHWVNFNRIHLHCGQIQCHGNPNFENCFQFSQCHFHPTEERKIILCDSRSTSIFKNCSFHHATQYRQPYIYVDSNAKIEILKTRFVYQGVPLMEIIGEAKLHQLKLNWLNWALTTSFENYEGPTLVNVTGKLILRHWSFKDHSNTVPESNATFDQLKKLLNYVSGFGSVVFVDFDSTQLTLAYSPSSPAYSPSSPAYSPSSPAAPAAAAPAAAAAPPAAAAAPPAAAAPAPADDSDDDEVQDAGGLTLEERLQLGADNAISLVSDDEDDVGGAAAAPASAGAGADDDVPPNWDAMSRKKQQEYAMGRGWSLKKWLSLQKKPFSTLFGSSSEDSEGEGASSSSSSAAASSLIPNSIDDDETESEEDDETESEDDEDDELMTCGQCGRRWDGNAQCYPCEPSEYHYFIPKSTVNETELPRGWQQSRYVHFHDMEKIRNDVQTIYFMEDYAMEEDKQSPTGENIGIDITIVGFENNKRFVEELNSKGYNVVDLNVPADRRFPDFPLAIVPQNRRV